MSKHPSSRILRIGLEEVLGDRRPPDLSARILQAFDASSPSANTPEDVARDERGRHAVANAWRDLMGSDPPVVPAEISAAPPAELSQLPQPQFQPIVRPLRSTEPTRFRPWWGLVAAVTAVLVTAGLMLLVQQTMNSVQLAQPTESPAPNPQTTPPIIRPRPVVEPPALDDRPKLAQSPVVDPSVQDSGTETAVSSGQTRPVAPWANATPPEMQAVAARLKQGLAARWTAAAITPTAAVDDAQWAERAFEILLGRAPDPYEAAKFADGNIDRAAWAKRLTESPEYRPTFADTWARRLADSLLDQQDVGRQRVSPEAFTNLLREELLSGGHFDRLVHRLLTATGSVSPGHDDFRPEASFLVSLDDGRGELATRRILERFLGEKARCAACHDHTGSQALSQADFWATAAHLRQLRITGDQESGIRLENIDFPGDSGDLDAAVVFYEDAQRHLVAAFPRFREPNGNGQSGRIAEFDRRRVLADHIVTDARFPAALVDWVWSEVFDHPLPQDDAIAKTRANLAADFAADGFHLDHLLQWIVTSPAFDRGAPTADRMLVDAPWSGTPALFSYRYPTVPQFASVSLALTALDRAYEDGSVGLLALRAGPAPTGESQLGPGVAASEEPTSQIDGRFARQGWNADPEVSQLLDRVIISPLSVREKVEHLFLLALDRAPNQAEWLRCEKLVENAPDRLAAYQDLWFVLGRNQDR